MMPGFIEVDRDRFYTEIWPHIHDRAEALESNWRTVRACLQEGRPAPDLLIHWGHKDPATAEHIIVAISQASATEERHWIAIPSLPKI